MATPTRTARQRQHPTDAEGCDDSSAAAAADKAGAAAKAEALKRAGNALYSQKRYVAAAEQYSKAIQLAPSNATLWSNRGARVAIASRVAGGDAPLALAARR